MSRLLKTLAILFLFASTASRATLIDFSGVPTTLVTTSGAHFDIDGYRFTLTSVAGGSSFFSIDSSASFVEANNTKLFSANHSLLTVSRVDGGLFDLLSFDIGGSWINSPSRWADSVSVSSTAGSVLATLPDQDPSYQFVSANLFGVSSVSFSPNGSGTAFDFEYTLDNLSVQTASVPEPAPLALLGVAIGMLVIQRRSAKR